MLLILTDRPLAALPENTITLTKLSSRLDSLDVEHCLENFLDLEFFLQPNDIAVTIDKKPLEKFSHIFFRRVGKFRHLANLITLYSKDHNLQSIDSYYEKTQGASKLHQMFLLAQNGLSIPKTYFSPEYTEQKIENAIAFLKLPMVVKFSSGRMGTGVFLAHTKEGLAELVQEHSHRDLILQEFIENDFDYRLLVLGEKIAVAEKRTRQESESFRNNVSLGADEEFINAQTVAADIASLALEAASVMSIEVAGIDVVTDPQGKSYILETNMCPAFTQDELISEEIKELSNYLCVWTQKK